MHVRCVRGIILPRLAINKSARGINRRLSQEWASKWAKKETLSSVAAEALPVRAFC